MSDAIEAARRDRYVMRATDHLLDLEVTEENVRAHRSAVAAARERYDELRAERLAAGSDCLAGSRILAARIEGRDTTNRRGMA